MADITLVNLNMLYVKFLDGKIMRQNHLALGPMYLVSALENAGIEVDFRDYQMYQSNEIFNLENFMDFLKDPSPILGLSCMANLLPFVLYALPGIKKCYPRTRIVLGGVGTAAVENEILKRFPEVDIIHKGEGDNTVPRLVKALMQNQSIQDIPSISFRENGSVIHNEKSPRIACLDNLNRPAYHCIDFSKYDGHNIMGSRGCPYPCTFCSITPIWGWKAFSRSAQNIINEMEYMHKEFGVEEFLFQDEYFVSSPKRTIEFCKLLKKRKLNIIFKVFARVDLVSKESMKALGKAGCIEIRFGIESGSNTILEAIKKGIKAEEGMKVLAKAKKYIPGVDAFYVWGYPFETMDDFSKTIFQMITFRGMDINCLPSLLTYLPQTVLYQSIPNKEDMEFCPYLLPEYMVSGFEDRLSVRVNTDNENAPLFNFIKQNKDIFPGFFHLDIEGNIIPKLEMLEQFGFYAKPEESCGAHSPSKVKMALNV
ncbi:MAG: B12-binding domain-containing radical SAM protein [Bacteroidales bacterium]|nr:B12-binding domain-containing radical SAM protein [Bacteroidales bacterium]